MGSGPVHRIVQKLPYILMYMCKRYAMEEVRDMGGEHTPLGWTVRQVP